MTTKSTRIKRKSAEPTSDPPEDNPGDSQTPAPAAKRKVLVRKKSDSKVSRVIRRSAPVTEVGAPEPSPPANPPPSRNRVEPETMKVEEVLETGGMPKVKTLAVKRPLPPELRPSVVPVEIVSPAAPEAGVMKKPPPLREVLGEPTFKFFCYRCGQKLQVPVSWANKQNFCARCGHDILIPPPLIGEFW